MRLPLAEDEEVRLHLHPHWKAFLLPALTLIATCGFASFLMATLPGGEAAASGRLVIAVLAVMTVLVWSVRPVLRWRSTAYVLTNRRLITREGAFSRRGHDLPLSRIHDVSFSHTLVERLLGCGTLVVESTSERGQLELADIPRVEVVQAELYRLVEEQDTRRRGPEEEETPL